MKAFQTAGSLIVAVAIVLTGCGNNGSNGNNVANGANGGAAANTGEANTNTGSSGAAGAENTNTGTNEDAGAPAAGGQSQDAAPADSAAVLGAVKQLVEELQKPSGKIDFAAAETLYNDKVKAIVQARDAETQNQVHEQLTAALQAAKDGSLSTAVVGQLFDKLLQKVAFLQLRHDFTEASELSKTDKDKAKAELKEARDYYDGILKGMVEKRDAAYKTQLQSVIEGGFSEMEKAVDSGDALAFGLGRQLVDKSLMKAFYLASGAELGYGYKVQKAVKEGSKEDPKVMQAEGWAFFQSLKAYLEEFAPDAAKLIDGQFDLSNDVKNVKGDQINQAYIRAFAATAKGEYKETFEKWGTDKSVITALEGALFIEVIKNDLPKALAGEAKAKALADNAQQLLDKVKAGDKAAAEALYKKVEADLNTLAAYGSAA